MKVTGVTFRIDRAQLKRSLVAAVNSGVNRAGDVYRVGIMDSFTKLPKGTHSQPGQPPSIQNGNLYRGITKNTAKDGVCIVHTSNIRYAAMLEFGGTVRARAGRALPVPVGAAGRRIMRDTQGKGLKTSGVPMTMIRRKGKPPLLVRAIVRRGKNSSKILGSEILFVLKKSVTIKPRPYMSRAEKDASLYAKAVTAFEAGATAEIRRAFKP